MLILVRDLTIYLKIFVLCYTYFIYVMYILIRACIVYTYSDEWGDVQNSVSYRREKRICLCTLSFVYKHKNKYYTYIVYIKYFFNTWYQNGWSLKILLTVHWFESLNYLNITLKHVIFILDVCIEPSIIKSTSCKLRVWTWNDGSFFALLPDKFYWN